MSHSPQGLELSQIITNKHKRTDSEGSQGSRTSHDAPELTYDVQSAKLAPDRDQEGLQVYRLAPTQTPLYSVEHGGPGREWKLPFWRRHPRMIIVFVVIFQLVLLAAIFGGVLGSQATERESLEPDTTLAGSSIVSPSASGYSNTTEPRSSSTMGLSGNDARLA